MEVRGWRLGTLPDAKGEGQCWVACLALWESGWEILASLRPDHMATPVRSLSLLHSAPQPSFQTAGSTR